ncbi:hypothetical protein N7454_002646 [Penicillium verhagenii]|nr:hypothetical protein N7454_002646 [Penicillium verhagenii]
MNGEIAANPRVAAPAFRKNDSARLGAAIAFQQSRPPSNVNPQSSAAAAAVFASRMNRHAENSTEMDSESGPEFGSVKDKIGRFAGSNSLAPPTTSSTQGRPRTPSISRSPIPKSPARSPGPEQLAAHAAARLAAERSPARKLEPTVDAARLGAMRSASRAQSQQPPPRSPGNRQELRYPLPVRPDSHRMLDDDLSSFDGEPGYARPLSTRSPSIRSRAGSVHSQATSPYPSTSRIPLVLPDEVAPKGPPLPPRSLASSQASLRKPMLAPSSLRATPSMASISGLSHNSSSSALSESGMNEEALSNAIVASSLASARASPMPKAPPPPPRRRRARSILQLTHSPMSDLSRTPSPPKGMPMTLRGIPKDSDANRRHKVKLLHKHPHKHNEGDRKRWRQEVTEKERKRYEGVWASNKGLLIPSNLKLSGTERWPPPSEMVLNLVVREIWSRSRLPSTVLEQVWSLVDSQNIGLLTKEEFVVGMWLIDQALKGHKLPVHIPDSIWDSVRYVTGIKLSSVGK